MSKIVLVTLGIMALLAMSLHMYSGSVSNDFTLEATKSKTKSKKTKVVLEDEAAKPYDPTISGGGDEISFEEEEILDAKPYDPTISGGDELEGVLKEEDTQISCLQFGAVKCLVAQDKYGDWYRITTSTSVGGQTAQQVCREGYEVSTLKYTKVYQVSYNFKALNAYYSYYTGSTWKFDGSPSGGACLYKVDCNNGGSVTCE